MKSGLTDVGPAGSRPLFFGGCAWRCEGESGTSPSGEIGGSPKGNYENESSGGLKKQNESADLLAESRYDATMLDEVDGGNGYGVKPTSNPDLLVEGNVFDVYSPGTTTGNRNIINRIASKAKTL